MLKRKTRVPDSAFAQLVASVESYDKDPTSMQKFITMCSYLNLRADRKEKVSVRGHYRSSLAYALYKGYEHSYKALMAHLHELLATESPETVATMSLLVVCSASESNNLTTLQFALDACYPRYTDLRGLKPALYIAAPNVTMVKKLLEIGVRDFSGGDCLRRAAFFGAESSCYALLDAHSYTSNEIVKMLAVCKASTELQTRVWEMDGVQQALENLHSSDRKVAHLWCYRVCFILGNPHINQSIFDMCLSHLVAFGENPKNDFEVLGRLSRAFETMEEARSLQCFEVFASDKKLIKSLYMRVALLCTNQTRPKAWALSILQNSAVLSSPALNCRSVLERIVYLGRRHPSVAQSIMNTQRMIIGTATYMQSLGELLLDLVKRSVSCNTGPVYVQECKLLLLYGVSPLQTVFNARNAWEELLKSYTHTLKNHDAWMALFFAFGCALPRVVNCGDYDRLNVTDSFKQPLFQKLAFQRTRWRKMRWWVK